MSNVKKHVYHRIMSQLVKVAYLNVQSGEEPDPEPLVGEVPLKWLARLAWAASKASLNLGTQSEAESLLMKVAVLSEARI